MRRFLRKIIFLVALFLSIATLATYYASYIEPSSVKYIAFAGFAFPYFWVITSILAFFAIVTLHLRLIIITAVSLIFTIGGFLRVARFDFISSKTADEKSLKILTFNVRGMSVSRFADGVKISDVVDYISNQNADIVCLQEMFFSKGQTKAGYNGLKDMFPKYKYIVSEEDVKNRPAHATGQVILSRYPLTYIELKDVSQSTDKSVLATDVDVDGTNFRIFNCHLESIRLSDEQLSAVSDARHAEIGDKTKQNLKTTYRKMADAFIERAVQARELVALIDSTEQNVVVCGDFNDTPISYCYNTIASNMGDAFVDAGHGIGNTYNGSLPPLRIDYILYSSNMEASTYTVDKVNLSDHYPVCSVVNYGFE